MTTKVKTGIACLDRFTYAYSINKQITERPLAVIDLLTTELRRGLLLYFRPFLTLPQFHIE
jgi:hypothetical protein